MGNLRRCPVNVFSTILPVIFATALYLALPGKQVVWAADESEDTINYAYSSWIGSGLYKIGDRTTYLLRAPFSYSLREADSDNWGLELLLPATIGFHDTPTDRTTRQRSPLCRGHSLCTRYWKTGG